MYRKLCILLLYYLVVIAHQVIWATPIDSSTIAEKIRIDSIKITGNKRTKATIILRELDFKQGDTLLTKQLTQRLKKNQEQVYNTRLFNAVKISIENQEANHLTLLITVEERWYIFPALVFELTDPNFNVWWKEHQHDLERTEYGMRFIHHNFRGLREVLQANIILGYTQKLELTYKIPYINKKQTIGIQPIVSYIRNREIPYQTLNFKQQLYKDTINNAFVRQRFRIGTSVTNRPNIYTTHFWQLTYFNHTIQKKVALLNPSYFLAGRTKQQYFQLQYEFINDHRDIRAYPLTGYYLKFQVTRLGLGIFKDIGINQLLVNCSRYFQLADRVFAGMNTRLWFAFPIEQPYFNEKGLSGNTSYVRGYELYVIDGQSFGLFRSLLKYKLLDKKLQNPLFNIEQLKTLSLALYLKIYGELGYVQHTSTTTMTSELANTLLKGGGVGLDIVTIYDVTIGLEYSWNARREKGFYINLNLNYE